MVTSKRILILDDEPIIQDIVAEILTPFGHELLSATTVAEARAAIEQEVAVAIIGRISSAMCFTKPNMLEPVASHRWPSSLSTVSRGLPTTGEKSRPYSRMVDSKCVCVATHTECPAAFRPTPSAM